MLKHKAIVAVDFDHFLARIGKFPEILGLQPGAKEFLDELRSEGCFIIIWTCRHDTNLINALQFLTENKAGFDLANENHPILIERYDNDSRKVCADFYVDDKTVPTPLSDGCPRFKEIAAEIKEACSRPDFKSVL